MTGDDLASQLAAFNAQPLQQQVAQLQQFQQQQMAGLAGAANAVPSGMLLANAAPAQPVGPPTEALVSFALAWAFDDAVTMTTIGVRYGLREPRPLDALRGSLPARAGVGAEAARAAGSRAAGLLVLDVLLAFAAGAASVVAGGLLR